MEKRNIQKSSEYSLDFIGKKRKAKEHSNAQIHEINQSIN